MDCYSNIEEYLDDLIEKLESKYFGYIVQKDSQYNKITIIHNYFDFNILFKKITENGIILDNIFKSFVYFRLKPVEFEICDLRFLYGRTNSHNPEYQFCSIQKELFEFNIKNIDKNILLEKSCNIILKTTKPLENKIIEREKEYLDKKHEAIEQYKNLTFKIIK